MALMLVLGELAARFVFPTSDVPDTIFHEKLGNHYRPGQQGVFVKGLPPTIQARYRINGQGWNSPHDYDLDQTSNSFRIAVIGDSYVEAFQVDYLKSFSSLLEDRINRTTGGRDALVYAYGHSGANLVQYSKVFEHAVAPVKPTVAIVVLVHNDFQESLTGHGRKDNWTLGWSGGEFVEVSPRPAGNLRLKRFARKSALARLLIVNLEIQNSVRLVRDTFYGDVRRFEANVDVEAQSLLNDEPRLRGLVQRQFRRLKEIAEAGETRLLILIDGDRRAIYAGENPRRSETYAYNRVSEAVARDMGIAFVDLTDQFERAWAVDHSRFESDFDYHWNEYGHFTVASAVFDWIRSEIPELVESSPAALITPSPRLN